MLCRQPTYAQQCEKRDDSLRDDAIETPDLERELFDEGQAEGKAEPGEGCENEDKSPARQGQRAKRQIAQNANSSNGDTMDNSKRAMVHNAAVPMGIDVARLSAGGEMNAKGKDRDGGAGEGEKCNQIPHHRE